ncbi:MAG: hypothetical protein P1P82_01640 [Bacteroidales bacterium]|nr:hypothetical protein [Bacteroidales bacterium]MDT8430247.1 hypothetical protein [Bacteroidales bacterium]
MKAFKKYMFISLAILLLVSCGRSGDPGHCFISVDWEYWNEDYGVYYYKDNNPDVPESQYIDPGFYYDSYPGYYEYHYEAEDPDEWFSYEGFYELFQNPGTEGGLFRDGWDGADTYFDLYLYVYARKGLGLKNLQVTKSATQPETPALETTSRSGRAITEVPVRTETRSWEKTDGAWTIRVQEEVKVYPRK